MKTVKDRPEVITSLPAPERSMIEVWDTFCDVVDGAVQSGWKATARLVGEMNLLAAGILIVRHLLT